MTIEAVLFDLDGTLLDRDASLEDFVGCQHERFPALQAVEREIFVRRFIELDRNGSVWKDKVYQQLILEFGFAGVQWHTLLDDYVSRFRRHCIGFPNLIRVLTRLKDDRIKLALISNGFGQFQYDNFKALGIAHCFDEVLISEWEGLRKPDRAIFERALAKLGVTPDKALFVGDHPEHDIRGSRDAGMRAVWKRNRRFDEAVGAFAAIDDLEELIRIVWADNRE